MSGNLQSVSPSYLAEFVYNGKTHRMYALVNHEPTDEYVCVTFVNFSPSP